MYKIFIRTTSKGLPTKRDSFVPAKRGPSWSIESSLSSSDRHSAADRVHTISETTELKENRLADKEVTYRKSSVN